jgi:hypothetical protein
MVDMALAGIGQLVRLQGDVLARAGIELGKLRA